MSTWRRRTLLLLVAIVGLGTGLALQFMNWGTPREKSVSRLLREVRAEDSTIGLLGQSLWPKLPLIVRGQLASFEPLPAVVIRRAAASELKARDLKGDQAIQAIIGALRDSDLEVRRAAIEILRELGLGAKAAVPALIELFESEKATRGFDPRGEIAVALAAIAPNNPNLARLFVSKLEDRVFRADPGSLVSYVIQALIRMGEQLPNAVTALTSAADHGHPNLTIQIVDSLGRSSLTNREVILCLQGHLTHDDLRVVLSAVTAIGEKGPAAASCVPALMSLFQKLRSNDFLNQPKSPTPDFVPPGFVRMDPAMIVRYGLHELPLEPGDMHRYRELIIDQAISSFGKIGSAAAPAIPLLESEYSSSTSPMRPAAAFARWQIDRDLDAVWNTLREGTRDGVINIRRTTAVYCAQIGDKALPLLLDMTHDNDSSVRLSVIQSLAKIGKPPLPAMIESLEDPLTQVRLLAIQALAALGPDARSAIPALQLRLSDSKYLVRKAAASALKEIQVSNGK